MTEEQEQRRNQFKAWLVRAWDYAGDHQLAIATDLADLISHAEEPDFPLWEQAKERGILPLGQGKSSQRLAEACGLPPAGQHASEWESEINYSPIVYLDEKVWRHIHGALGWVNRNHDPKLPMSFWLWSNAGNVVHFVVRSI